MKDVDCYLCGANVPITLFAQQGDDPYLNIVDPLLSSIPRYWCVCQRCGFVYRSPALEPDEMTLLYQGYDGVVLDGKDLDAYFDRIVKLPPEESENAQKADWLNSALERALLGRGIKELSVLDVGCGGGTLLYTMRNRFGLGEMFGIERNPTYAALAARRAEVKIRECEYRSGLFGQRFDLVVSTKVLEHISDPEPFVRHLADDVKLGGVLFLEVPDVSDVWSLPPDSDRFYIPHVYFYSRNTLGELLRRVGFEPIVSGVVATRGRFYLRMLAMHSKNAVAQHPPYDEPEKIVARIRQAAARRPAKEK